MNKYVIFANNVLKHDILAVYKVYSVLDGCLMIKNVDFDEIDHEAERVYWGPLEAFCDYYIPHRKDEIMYKVAAHLDVQDGRDYLDLIIQ